MKRRFKIDLPNDYGSRSDPQFLVSYDNQKTWQPIDAGHVLLNFMDIKGPDGGSDLYWNLRVGSVYVTKFGAYKKIKQRKPDSTMS